MAEVDEAGVDWVRLSVRPSFSSFTSVPRLTSVAKEESVCRGEVRRAQVLHGEGKGKVMEGGGLRCFLKAA